MKCLVCNIVFQSFGGFDYAPRSCLLQWPAQSVQGFCFSGELLVLVLLSCSAALGSAVSSADGHRVVLRNLAQGLGKLSYPLRLKWLLSEVGLKVVLLLQVSAGPCSFGSRCHERYESCRTFRVLSLSLLHRSRVCPDDGVLVWRMRNCQLWLGCAQYPPFVTRYMKYTWRCNTFGWKLRSSGE